jgi:hypothetical protein
MYVAFFGVIAVEPLRIVVDRVSVLDPVIARKHRFE